MTKRDYELIAKVLRVELEKFPSAEFVITGLASSFARVLKEDNPAFQSEKFFQAALLVDR